MAEKSIIIIGAGIAGLTAGIYGRLNGYKTSIFEMGIKPGGLCTAWERQGYIIDGCLHWLVGTSPKSSFYISADCRRTGWTKNHRFGKVHPGGNYRRENSHPVFRYS